MGLDTTPPPHRRLQRESDPAPDHPIPLPLTEGEIKAGHRESWQPIVLEAGVSNLLALRGWGRGTCG